MPETITTEAQATALCHGAIIRDRNGDAFQKHGETGWDMAGESGRWGPTWIAYPATVLYDPDKDTRAPVLDTMSQVRDFMKAAGRNQAAFVTADGKHILVHRSPGDGFGYGVVDPESHVQWARLQKESRWPLTPLTSATGPLSDQITRALGTDDWLILHDGHHLITADELDAKS